MHSPSALTERVSLNLAGTFLLDPVRTYHAFETVENIAAQKYRDGLKFSEYEKNKLRSPACSSQENATFSPHLHKTWGPPYSASLYNHASQHLQENGHDHK